MAFIRFKVSVDGKQGKVISHKRGELLQYAMNHRDRLSEKDRAYVDNIKQLVVPVHAEPVRLEPVDVTPSVLPGRATELPEQLNIDYEKRYK